MVVRLHRAHALLEVRRRDDLEISPRRKPHPVLAVVGVVIQAGTMNLQQIVVAQNAGAIFGFDGLGNPYVLTQIVGFVVFMIAIQAELTQAPFDMPIAEISGASRNEPRSGR